MLRRSLSVGSIARIPVRLDVGWFVLLGLMLWLLPTRYLNAALPGQPPVVLWMVAIVAAALFLAIILLHELAHAFVARAMHLPVDQITLTLFGGSVKLGQDREHPSQELLIALAGPASTILVGILFGLVDYVVGPSWPLIGVPARFLRTICVALGLFNLLPALPLDGGQALRAIIWSVSGDEASATRWAARAGHWVGSAITIGGLLLMLSRESLEGAWIAVIGLLVDSGARAAQRRVSVQHALAGQVAADAMRRRCVPLPPDLTLDRLDATLAESLAACLLVGDEQHVTGLLAPRRLRRIHRSRWEATSLGQVQIALTDSTQVSPELPLDQVLERLSEQRLQQLPVMRDGELLGIIDHDDVVALIQKRIALGIG